MGQVARVQNPWRTGGYALVGLFALSLAGDPATRAAGMATIMGQDPLEVLSVKIKPNVFVILDTSGSMMETPYTGTQYGGDHTGSKMFLAKQVLKDVFQANQTKAQFLFGNYRYAAPASNTAVNMGFRVNQTPNRFLYSTQSWAAGTFGNPACTVDPTTCPAPNPATVTLPVEGPSPSMATTNLLANSLYAFQWIQNSAKIQNNRLVFTEASPALTCTVSVTPDFYRTGALAATAIQAAMNSCAGKSNTYTVTYGTTTTGRFSFRRNTGATSFTLRWSDAASTIRGVLAAGTANQTVTGTNTYTAGDARINLLNRANGNVLNETYDPDGASTTLTPALDKPSPSRGVRTYFLNAQKFWNGETVYVDSTGATCDIVDGAPTNPPTVSLQLTTNCANGQASASAANRATFTWSGGDTSGPGACQGFQQQVPLIPCDLATPPQADAIIPFLNNQLPLDAAGSIVGYSEGVLPNDGTGTVVSNPAPGGVLAAGNTPLAQSLNDIRGIFLNLWNNGQAAPALDPIRNHLNPKEKSIVLMVTDGDQNCSPFTLNMTTGAPYSGVPDGDDSAALGAAAAAQKLYNPDTAAANGNGTAAGTVNTDGTINGDAAASVTTYVIAFGAGLSKTRADWIAWGGSGMKRTLGTYSGNSTWTTIPTAVERSKCVTCTDAFLAPDPDTLKSVLQSVIDVGAQSGEFTAQQSVFGSIPEYVGLASTCSGAGCNPGQDIFSIDYPDKAVRYGALVPTLVSSSFLLPGFKGHVKAYQQDLATGNTVLRWSAGDVLQASVTNGMTASCPVQVATGALAGQCTITQLHGNTTDATIGPSTAAIKRRIYSTRRNGVFTSDGTAPYTPTALAQVNPPAPDRVVLWPPSSSIAPTGGTVGTFDAELGLPTTTANATADLATLKATFKACVGSNLPTDCTGTDANALEGARREARQMLLAYLAGAIPVLDAAGAPKRALAAGAGTARYDLLFRARDWVLSESTQAAGALMVPPSYGDVPLLFSDEFKLFRDGYHEVLGLGVEPSDNQLLKGFALAHPDDDKSNTHGSDPTLKPAMSVVFTPANDMLHAFRAAPSCLVTNVIPTGCADNGGEELWGFLPYDQLGSIKARYAAEPQARDNHVFVMASSVRLAEVFVPGNLRLSALGSTKDLGGVWRKVLYVGRGIAGKYLTAIDVTGIGPYTTGRFNTSPPIPLWSRGNPDTVNGAASGATAHNAIDATAYSRMGQTWSVPAVAFVDPAANTTARNPNGVNHVLYVGSGYSDKAAEGSTLFVLDALTGDVVAAPDVGDRAGMSYENAIVANPAAFTPKHFTVLTPTNPSVGRATRVVFGDVHGRLWKILTNHPNIVVPVADVGADQPLGTAVGLLGIDPYLNREDWLTKPTPTQYIYAMSGNDLRATGPFKLFAFKDGGTDDDTVPTGNATQNGVVVFSPAESLYAAEIAQGTPPANCGYTAENYFRGTVQPTTTFSCQGGISGNQCTDPMGNATFAATRLNLPLTKYAPPTPLACGDSSFQYPCRSSFDSILYSLHSDVNAASYDLTGDGNPDAYRVLNNTRIVSLQWVPSVDPNRKSSTLFIDNGIVDSARPPRPPKPGKPVIGMGHVAVLRGTNAGRVDEASGQEMASFGPRFGSVVCHD